MLIKKAVITAAAPTQRRLPLQTIIDRDGHEQSVLAMIVAEAARAGIDDVAIVVFPGDEEAYAKAAGTSSARLRFLPQTGPRGYAHAVFCARDFTASDPFLHLVGDHIYLSLSPQSCAEQLVALAAAENCSVSAVQDIREGLLPYYGAVGGHRLPGHLAAYRIETVREKPTPTEAEQTLVVPGLRAGHYLCFFGMHVLTPTVMDILEEQLASGSATLSGALNELARREQYLALQLDARRYDVGVKYGVLTAQLALALTGTDRDAILSQLLEVVATAGANAQGVRV